MSIFCKRSSVEADVVARAFGFALTAAGIVVEAPPGSAATIMLPNAVYEVAPSDGNPETGTTTTSIGYEQAGEFTDPATGDTLESVETTAVSLGADPTAMATAENGTAGAFLGYYFEVVGPPGSVDLVIKARLAARAGDANSDAIATFSPLGGSPAPFEACNGPACLRSPGISYMSAVNVDVTETVSANLLYEPFVQASVGADEFADTTYGNGAASADPQIELAPGTSAAYSLVFSAGVLPASSSPPAGVPEPNSTVLLTSALFAAAAARRQAPR